jgi:magnesium-transporting ATPase (P-type)
LEARNALAVVVNVGYGTRKGRIIRKILNRVPIMPDFFKTALIFLVETCIIALVIYFITIKPLLLVKGIPKIFAGFRFMDFIAWSFPPVFPIFFNLSYSFSLIRMKWRGITGTEP